MSEKILTYIFKNYIIGILGIYNTPVESKLTTESR